jgi:hypothetical protein
MDFDPATPVRVKFSHSVATYLNPTPNQLRYCSNTVRRPRSERAARGLNATRRAGGSLSPIEFVRHQVLLLAHGGSLHDRNRVAVQIDGGHGEDTPVHSRARAHGNRSARHDGLQVKVRGEGVKGWRGGGVKGRRCSTLHACALDATPNRVLTPSRWAVDPSEAALPTCQKMFSALAPLVRMTLILSAILNALPIWKIQTPPAVPVTQRPASAHVF